MRAIGGGACLLLGGSLLVAVMVRKQPSEVTEKALDDHDTPRLSPGPLAMPDAHELARQLVVRRESVPPASPAGLVAWVDPRFRPANEAEVVLLGEQVAREVEKLEHDVRWLDDRSKGTRTAALLLTQEKLARRKAAAQEVRAGRVFVRNGPVPREAVAECRAKDGEICLVDEGGLRAAVFLDPAVHQSWAAARDAWRHSGFESPETTRLKVDFGSVRGSSQPAVSAGERR